MTNRDHDGICIKVDLNPSHKNDEIVRQALHEFNVKQIGKDEHYSIFAFNQQNEIIGGSLVYTETRSIFIDILWVKESERAKRIGSKILLAAENEGLRRKIRYSTLDTYAFQAVNFYLKHGYKQIGVIKDYIEGHDRVFFRKQLN